MKFETTKKQMRENYHTILMVGYCDLQSLLNYESPIAYSHGVNGWACDYYELIGNEGQRVIISTGYSPIGQSVDYKLVDAYEKKANEIRQSGKKDTAKRLQKLIKQFLKELSL